MSNTEPSIGLHPLNGCVLVELKQSYSNVTIKEKKYDSRTEGIVVAVDKGSIAWPPTTYSMTVEELIGKRVHFDDFKEGARIIRNGKTYSFIKFADIRGYENE